MTDPPTVAFVTLPAGLGGSARSLATVLGGLRGRVRRVVVTRPGTRFAAHVATHDLADELVPLRAGRGERLGRLADGARLTTWGVRHRGTVRAVHANGLSELNLAVPLALALDAPVVVWVHDWDISPNARRLAALHRTLPVELRWVTVSDAARRALVRSGVPGAAAVDVVPNPIDPDDVRAPERPRSIDRPVEAAYLGSPAPYKGFDLLPALVEGVRIAAPGVRWRIWSGPRTTGGETWQHLDALAGPGLVLEDKVDDVRRAYGSADIVVCPSREESFGRVAAEAMVNGIPVVASDLPALREVLGPAGVLVPPGDVAGTVAAIAALAADPEQRARLGELGRARAEDFGPDRVLADLTGAYRLDRPRAVVVSHEATRTGAPVVAARTAAALAPIADVDTVLRWPGPLDPAFRRTSVVRTEPARRLRVALRRFRRTAPVATRLEEAAAGRVLDRLRPDLVWCHTVLSGNYVRPARRRGIPVVLHVHELGRLVPGALRRYDLGPRLVDDGLAVVAASTAAAAELRSEFGLGAGDVTVIPSPVDVAEIRRRAGAADVIDGALVVACGHATERKGIDQWLAVAARVRAEDPTARFRWVGREATRFAPQAAALGLARDVELVDEVADPVPHLARAAVFTLPSRWDTFPLVVLEAMALGRPVVAFDAGGMAEQLGDAGILVPAGDLDAFARAVLDLLHDPARARALGAAAAERVARFDLPPFVDAVQALASRLLPTVPGGAHPPDGTAAP